MKVYIGPYKRWFGPYELAEKICFWHTPDPESDKENYVERFGEYLSNIKPLVRFLNWIYEGDNRKIKVEIHDYDTWNMDGTLAHIIHPMLVQLKKTKHGSPNVDNEDVPANLHKPDGSDEWDADANHHLRWDWVMDEMIWAFETSSLEWPYFVDDNGVFDVEGSKKYYDRRANGFRLFGKYYQGLWD